MRCGLRSIVLLMLVATPSVSADSLVCHPIQRGESASHVARRLTGDGRNTYQAWFQIMNASSRFVPKSQYDRIHAGWQACLVRPAVVERVSSTVTSVAVHEAAAMDAPRHVEAAAAKAVVGAGDGAAVSSSPNHNIERVDLTVVWLGAAMIVPLVGWRVVDDYLARQRTASIVMRYFADRFVAEFDRPLIRDHGAVRAVRFRFRCNVRRGRLDILLAPGKGRRYPNLSDHRKNVEYDVARVLHSLGDASVVSGPLFTQAGWVVVPFQFKGVSKQAGVPCMSSF